MKIKVLWTPYFYCFIWTTFGQVLTTKNASVIPRCGSQLITIEINFDPDDLPHGKFTDWIVVGVSGKPECRLKGNGEIKYIIEIAVFNDPCLTQIPAQNVFQNRIRIGKNPVIILEEDQSVTVKCVYGLPTVESMRLPIINSNFNIEKQELNNQAFQIPEEIKQNFGLESLVTALTTPDNHNKLSGDKFVADFQTDTTNLDLMLTSEFPESNSNYLDGPNKFSLSIILFTIIICIILVLILLLVTLFFCIKGRNIKRKRTFLIDRVSEFTDSFKPSEFPHSKLDVLSQNQSQFESQIEKRLLETQNTRKLHSGTLHSLNKNDRLPLGQNSFCEVTKEKNAMQTSNLPLKSNLDEFVSKTNALGEYNNVALPYDYTLDVDSEREKDYVTSAILRTNKTDKNRDINQKCLQNVDRAVSSFCSITEIVHAAETTRPFQENQKKWSTTDIQKMLCDCVLSIRGFGYRKLTEQEIIRWQNLINQDGRLRDSLLMSKSSAEIENTFGNEEYKNMFSSSKWHEIALCVHRVLTENLDRSNSIAELKLFVGNVQTDW